MPWSPYWCFIFFWNNDIAIIPFRLFKDIGCFPIPIIDIKSHGYNPMCLIRKRIFIILKEICLICYPDRVVVAIIGIPNRRWDPPIVCRVNSWRDKCHQVLNIHLSCLCILFVFNRKFHIKMNTCTRNTVDGLLFKGTITNKPGSHHSSHLDWQGVNSHMIASLGINSLCLANHSLTFFQSICLCKNGVTK